MPRTNSITPTKRIEDQIYKRIKCAMAMESIKQYHIAGELGIHKTTCSQHFKHHSFSLEQIIDICEFLGLEIKVCDKC